MEFSITGERTPVNDGNAVDESVNIMEPLFSLYLSDIYWGNPVYLLKCEIFVNVVKT